MEQLAVNVATAAKMLSLSRSACYSLIEQGILPAVRIGDKRLIVPVESLRLWIQQQVKTQVQEGDK